MRKELAENSTRGRRQTWLASVPTRPSAGFGLEHNNAVTRNGKLACLLPESMAAARCDRRRAGHLARTQRERRLSEPVFAVENSLPFKWGTSTLAKARTT